MRRNLALKPQWQDDAELRTQPRMDLRPSDGLSGTIIRGDQRVAAQLFDISIRGVCLLVKNSDKEGIVIGDPLRIEVKAPDQKVYNVEGIVRWSAPFADSGTRYGVEIPWKGVQDKITGDVTIPEFLPLVGVIYKPYLFYERANFRLLNLSNGFWLIKVYDTEIFAFEGTELDLYFQNSLGLKQGVKVRVVRIAEIEAESVTIYVNVVSLDEETSEWMGQQLVFNCNLSPEKARSIGFTIKSVSNGFRFRFVKTKSEYEDVLGLRLRAYREAGKVGEDKKKEEMAAPLDHLSRIIAVYHGDQIVGSVAISFPNSDDMFLDTEKAFAGGYPKQVPPKTKLIEIARLCTHSDYRQTDLLNRIFEYTYKTLHCGDRDFILTSTDHKLWPLYKKLGFKKTGMSYPHPYLSGIEHFIILGTRETPDSIKGISPLVWNYLWRDMNAYLTERGELRPSWGMRVWVGINVAIGKLLKINLKKRY